MTDEDPITINMSLWGFDKVKLRLIDLISRLVDPENLENPTKQIYADVLGGHPENTELFNGVVAKVLLSDKKDDIQVGGEFAKLTGLILTYVPGNNEDSATTCNRNCDIVESLLKNLTPTIIGIRNCKIIPNPNNTQNWTSINVTPREKTPTMCVLGVTGFIVTKGREAPIEVTI
jgi:hypothetical protein